MPETVDPTDPYSFACSESLVTSSIVQPVVTAVTNKSASVTTAGFVSQSTPSVTIASKTKATSVLTNLVSSHKTSQPKISGSKTKEKTNSCSKNNNSDNKNLNSSPHKKKRPSSSVPNGSSVSKPPILPILSPTTSNVTLSHVAPQQTLPIQFPLTIGDSLGALSRFQVANRNNLTLSPAIIRSPGLTTFGSAPPQPVISKDTGVMVTNFEALNGQMPVSNALLHSVTVSRPLLATSAGGLGITLGAAGLVGQFSQLPKCSIYEELNSNLSGNLSSNKNSHTISSVLSNSHVLTSATGSSSSSTWSRTKAKSKTRKNSKTGAVNSLSPSQSACDNSVSSALQVSTHGNSFSNVSLSHSLSSPQATSPQLHSGSTSPQVPISSPLHNGLGPSPPPQFFSPKTISISGTMSSSQPLSLSPVSRTSTPSPGTDLSSPGSTSATQKGKNFSRTLTTSLPPLTAVSDDCNTFQVSVPLTFSTVNLDESSSSMCGTDGSQPVSFEELLSNSTFLDAHLYQSRQQSGKIESSNDAVTRSSRSPDVTTAILPLKLPLIVSSGTVFSQQLPINVSKRNGISNPNSMFQHH